MTAFADFRKMVADSTLLSTDFHAERFEVRSTDGGPHQRVSATRRRTQPVVATADGEEVLTESFALTVGRDPSDASQGTDPDGFNMPGGIQNLVTGLAVRAIADADQRWFAWTGEIIASTPHSITLGFSRRLATAAGTNSMRR
jgi:hypothetical protein